MKITLTNLLCAVLLMAGCSSGDGKVAVNGTVTWNGSPLSKGTITFMSPENISDAAPIHDGRFKIRTLPGEKTVGITATKIVGEYVDEERGCKTAVEHQFIPHNYNEQSTLKASITGSVENLTFDLKGEENPPPATIDPKNRPPVKKRSR